MTNKNEPVRLTLTPEQQAEVSKATGKSAEAIVLTVEELEERIAPVKQGFWKPVY